MEKVIKEGLVSCSNAMYGCKQSTMYGNKSSNHEKVYVFAPCSCPVKNCNYIGSYKDLNNHVRAVHKPSETLIIPFVFNRLVIFGLGTCKHETVIFQEEKEGDVIVVEGFIGSQGVYVTVSHIAPMVPEVRKFSSSLANVKQYSSLRLGLRVKNIQKLRSQEELPENDFLLIPSYMLSGGGNLKMQIQIGNEDDYIHI